MAGHADLANGYVADLPASQRHDAVVRTPREGPKDLRAQASNRG